MEKIDIYNHSEIANIHIPRWEELPEIDLYLDQVVNFIEKYLNTIIKDDTKINNSEKNKSGEEKIITKTMINNYVKQKILDPPEKKKYNKKHIAYLFVICILKQVYSINDIDKLIKLALKTSKPEKAYNKFCIALESAIAFTFAGKEYIDDSHLTFERYILKNVVQSFANKLYVQKVFLEPIRDRF